MGGLIWLFLAHPLSKCRAFSFPIPDTRVLLTIRLSYFAQLITSMCFSRHNVQLCCHSKVSHILKLFKLQPDSLSLGSPGWIMDNGLGKIKVLPDYFEASTPTGDCLPTPSSSLQPSDHPLRSHSRLWGRRRFRSASTMLNLFSPRFQWGSNRNSEKVELTAAELESLRTNFVNAEQRETHLKAQLEHLDELLRSARLVGYLYIRTRWAALPGEPPIDDSDVDDWLPRFVVLHGSCIFFYFQSGDISPQDSTLLSDVVELGPLPSFIQEDKQTRYSFYISTRQGLRFECSSVSKVQVGSWLAALRNDCNLESDSTSKDPIKS